MKSCLGNQRKRANQICKHEHYSNLANRYISFFQLGNSGNSAISVKGKGFTDVKMYVERKVFFERSDLITRPPSTKCQ